MTHVFSRPLVWLTASFALGMAIESCRPSGLPVKPAFWTVSVLFLCLVAGLFLRSPRIRNPVLLLLLFVGLGILSGRLAAPILPFPPGLEPFFDRPRSLFLAQVTAPPEFYSDKTRIPLRLSHAVVDGRWVPVQGCVLLTLSGVPASPAEWVQSDRLLVRINLKRLHNFNNPGSFDYVRSQAERGFYARAHVSDRHSIVKLASVPEFLPFTIVQRVGGRLDRFRQHAFFWLKGHLDPDTGDFYAGLLLGYRVPASWQEHLNRTGVTHLLSISGLHLGLVSMISFWLVCRLVRIFFPSLLKFTSDRQIALWLALVPAVLYAFISGLALPTWRSLIMLGLLVAGSYWYLSSDPVSALAAAALLILFISPNSLRQVSFQLSFAAMFGLFCLYPRFHRLQNSIWKMGLGERHPARRALTPFVDAFWVSLAANVMVFPLLVYHFHGISLAGLLANTILVPIVGFLVLPPGLASLGLYTLNEHLALPVLQLGAWFLGYCQKIILWFSQLSWAFFWTGSVPAFAPAFFYAGLAVVLRPWKWKRKGAVLAFLVVSYTAASFLGHAPTQGKPQLLEVIFIDVGQGTSTLVRFPTGETMLVDGGGFYDDTFDIGRSVLAPFLWQAGIRELTYVVMSHDHPDHRNGLRFILSDFRVGGFWESGFAASQGASDGPAVIASRRKVPIGRVPEIVGEHSVGQCTVNVIHPTPSYIEERWDGSDMNNVSLVLEISYGDTRLILPGDISRSVEHHIFSNYSASGEVLLASPHHGSHYSNSPLLLDRLKPRAIVFSCGYDNTFGFPAPVVLQECRNRNIPCYRTDLQGAIQALSDGRRWEIRPVRSE